MTEIFIVAWTGGYESPQLFAKPTQDEAVSLAREWRAESSEPGDSIDVFRVDLAILEIVAVEFDEPDQAGGNQ